MERFPSIEYLTHFNYGNVSQGENGQTIREFILILEENQNITISNAGHYFDAWRFNGTVPGPTMRMTEGDLVRINVINDKQSKHTYHCICIASIQLRWMGLLFHYCLIHKDCSHEVADGHNTHMQVA